MKTVGLCKTFSCADFLPAILNTIVPKLDYIVFVNSYVNWLGQVGDNECLPVIKNWKENAEHILAQNSGEEMWYKSYKVRICKVERDYIFEPKHNS